MKTALALFALLVLGVRVYTSSSGHLLEDASHNLLSAVVPSTPAVCDSMIPYSNADTLPPWTKYGSVTAPTLVDAGVTDGPSSGDAGCVDGNVTSIPCPVGITTSSEWLYAAFNGVTYEQISQPFTGDGGLHRISVWMRLRPGTTYNDFGQFKIFEEGPTTEVASGAVGLRTDKWIYVQLDAASLVNTGAHAYDIGFRAPTNLAVGTTDVYFAGANMHLADGGVPPGTNSQLDTCNRGI